MSLTCENLNESTISLHGRSTLDEFQFTKRILIGMDCGTMHLTFIKNNIIGGVMPKYA
jgi:hypothetical protein